MWVQCLVAWLASLTTRYYFGKVWSRFLKKFTNKSNFYDLNYSLLNLTARKISLGLTVAWAMVTSSLVDALRPQLECQLLTYLLVLKLGVERAGSCSHKLPYQADPHIEPA